jgi:uncharacterized membrane protein
MDGFEHVLEDVITDLAELLRLSLEGIALLCILIGLVTTLVLAVRQRWRRSRRGLQAFLDPELSLARVRLNFGVWLSIALEFQLGSDIVRTTVAPSLEALGNLALLALIRTFLNFFLAREITAERYTISHAQKAVSTSETLPS